MKNASDKNPPRRARRKAVPMKFVTLFADFEGEKCMFFLKYNTKLLAFARNERFSNISTTTQKKNIISNLTILTKMKKQITIKRIQQTAEIRHRH